jgi:mRNA-degrading endonuclease RelE of RelBE toxin-antitoxin system
VVIVETTIFTRQVVDLLPDDEYRKLQAALVGNPELGQLIKGTGGLRKVRWSLPGRGKSGGVRVIYYWAVKEVELFMLLIYAKSEQDDLTPKQRKVLKQIVKEEYR